MLYKGDKLNFNIIGNEKTVINNDLGFYIIRKYFDKVLSDLNN